MSLRTIQRLMMASALSFAAVAAAGCDDEESSDNDASTGDGDGDGGKDGGEEGLMCTGSGDTVCPSLSTQPGGGGIVFDACCDDKAGNACGLDLGLLQNLVPAGPDGERPPNPFAQCFATGQPGEGSTACNAFFDWADGDDPLDTDDKFTYIIPADPEDPESDPQVFTFDGCCADTGECGLLLNEVTALGITVPFGIGCVPLSRFTSPDAVLPTTTPPNDGFCTPGTNKAECPAAFSETLCGGLATKLGWADCPVGEAPPDWYCSFRGLPRRGEDSIPEIAAGSDCFVGLPKLFFGCGIGTTEPPTPATPCIPNAHPSVIGCDTVTDETVLLAIVPEFVCGCGETTPTDGTCLGFTDDDICGKAPISLVSAEDCAEDSTVSPLCALPSYACGCGDDERGKELPCLPYVGTDICGRVAACTGVTKPVPTQGSCPGGEFCVDPFPAGGDNVGDACGCLNAPANTCAANTTDLKTCTPTALGAHCTCGTVGTQGDCDAGEICADNIPAAADDGFGDTCVPAPT